MSRDRTLKDYRPQHDRDCAVFARLTMTRTELSRHPNQLPCSCGLDDLLRRSASRQEEDHEQKKDGAEALERDCKRLRAELDSISRCEMLVSCEVCKANAKRALEVGCASVPV